MRGRGGREGVWGVRLEFMGERENQAGDEFVRTPCGTAWLCPDFEGQGRGVGGDEGVNQVPRIDDARELPDLLTISVN